ncbi:valine--tRNA ligase, partial [bacterium SM23_31]
IVNWCPFHKTALSDEEVKHAEKQGNFWYIYYPMTEGDGSITVATTRPETMLGDTAIAVSPQDERYKHLVGKTVQLPILNRTLPIITDDFVDAKFGTGAVKVTPAHDPNDFEIGRRHDLPYVVVIDESGKMTAEAGALFEGLDRFECRNKLVAELEKRGLLEKTENHTYSIGICYRCSTVIEPLLSDQWFLKMAPLAEKAIKAVKKGEITFYPKKWEKDFFYWMENIRDWCISRQLWWGHRVPVWYCKTCGEIIASPENPVHCRKCNSNTLKQDEDVLDTWFSSWLWPFSTLNWPKNTPEMKYFYPTSVLVSGYDILFFWIARMIMAGLWFTGKKPFNSVYITGMIKDELGRIMTKSLGNGIDPLEMVEKYGADAVRYSLIALSTEGQDIKLSRQKFEMGRNFANKIWNAYRFLKMKESEVTPHGSDVTESGTIEDLSDRWILSRLHSTWRTAFEKFNQFKLNEALNAIYNFLWHDYCDWYVEILKDRLNGRNSEASASLMNVALPTFKKTMEMLHPFMPFITEEIWQNIAPHGAESIMITNPGNYSEGFIAAQSEKDMMLIQQIIYSVRNVRGEMNVPPAKKAQLIIKCSKMDKLEVIRKHLDYIFRLSGIEKVDMGPDMVKPPQSATVVIPEMEIYIPLAGLINIEEEHKRLSKEVARLKNQIRSIKSNLSNKEFLKKAPANVVEKEHEKLDTFAGNVEKLQNNLIALEEQ